MHQFGKESLQTIQEVANLIARTETLVETLGRLLPTDHKWMEWRHYTLQRRVEDLKRELKMLIEHAQVIALQHSVEERQRKQG